MKTEPKEQLIDSILNMEWAMFKNVNLRGHEKEADVPNAQPTLKAACQESPDEFRLQRMPIFSLWSCATLESYLSDLETARIQGRNLMTLKYARMDNLIPRENLSPLIEKISAEKINWQKEFIMRYPGIMSQGRVLQGEKIGVDWASFETYTKSELETYSEKTLEALYENVLAYKAARQNMSELVYQALVKANGYESLDAAEAMYQR